MTTRFEQPARGRERGPVAVSRAFIEVLVRPSRFFRQRVAAGDQASGLTFAMAVVLVEETTRLASVPAAIPDVAGGRLIAAMLALGIATLLVTPVALHLVGAVLTLILRPLVDERHGVDETVQVLAYATAPCALAGAPVPALRVACAVYGSWLLVVGLATVHGTSWVRAAAASAVPAALVFGYGFRGFAAGLELLTRWGVP